MSVLCASKNVVFYDPQWFKSYFLLFFFFFFFIFVSFTCTTAFASWNIQWCPQNVPLLLPFTSRVGYNMYKLIWETSHASQIINYWQYKLLTVLLESHIKQALVSLTLLPQETILLNLQELVHFFSKVKYLCRISAVIIQYLGLFHWGCSLLSGIVEPKQRD